MLWLSYRLCKMLLPGNNTVLDWILLSLGFRLVFELVLSLRLSDFCAGWFLRLWCLRAGLVTARVVLLFLLGFLRLLGFLSVFCAPGWVPVLVRFQCWFVICAGWVSVPWFSVLAGCLCLLGVCFRLSSGLVGCLLSVVFCAAWVLFSLVFCYRGYLIRGFNLLCVNYMFT
jgi:hypothetical protein